MENREGKLPQVPRRFGAPPVKYRKLKTHFEHIINNTWFLLLCRPDFPEQNELFSLTNLFMRNTNAGFQSLAITLETRAAEQMKK